jgi:hypothetical protein
MKHMEEKLRFENDQEIPVLVRRAGAYEIRQHRLKLEFCDYLAAFGAGSLVCMLVWVVLTW